MTLQEYKWERMKKDKQDYKYYEKEIKYWLKLIPLAGIGYLVISITMSVLKG